MKITTAQFQSQVELPAILAFDVSKDRLNLATRIAGRMSDYEFDNRTSVIEERLTAFKRRVLIGMQK